MKGKTFDRVVCCGVRAEKWLANIRPEQDIERIQTLERVLDEVTAGEFIHISTVDVYDKKTAVDESHKINAADCDHYGRNRLVFEGYVSNRFNNSYIVRLPGLFGTGLKKNFLYDILNPVPAFLAPKLFDSWDGVIPASGIEKLKSFYTLRSDGIYARSIFGNDREILDIFSPAGFSALSFTDSRSSFQFFDLAGLAGQLDTIVASGVRLINIVSEPVTAAEIYKHFSGNDFVNEISASPVAYNIRTLHGNADGYQFSKQEILEKITRFLNEMSGKKN